MDGNVKIFTLLFSFSLSLSLLPTNEINKAREKKRIKLSVVNSVCRYSIGVLPGEVQIDNYNPETTFNAIFVGFIHICYKAEFV